MNLALALTGYAVLVAVLAPRLLGASWTDRSPRLAVAAWQTATASIIAAVFFARLALGAPSAHLHRDPRQLVTLCAQVG